MLDDQRGMTKSWQNDSYIGAGENAAENLSRGSKNSNPTTLLDTGLQPTGGAYYCLVILEHENTL
jgi:hypothetical protein